jgi:hypothetical protein
MPDEMVYCDTRKEAIEARRQLRAKGLDASFGKAKRWSGYNVAGYRSCFCWHRIKAALIKPKPTSEGT